MVVLRHPIIALEINSNFNKLWGSLTSEAAKHFYWYLQSRDIKAWNAKDILTSEWGCELREHSSPRLGKDDQ
jgi:hypothetical protein